MADTTRPTFAPFRSFWMAGFECASHRRQDGVQLDLLRASGHDRFALTDYRACHARGFSIIRDGLRWHLIERVSEIRLN